jgi:hypothetical protein
MNPYAMLGSGAGTTEAAHLRTRLTAWHDAMVAHERRLRAGNADDRCDDECPHAEARILWSEALGIFGPRANDLTFLRSRASSASRRSRAGAGAGPHSEAADTITAGRTTNAHEPTVTPSMRTQPAEL